jgi:hypothetical protein
MATRKPLVVVSGLLSELPPNDSVEGVILTTTLTAGSGLSGGGPLSTSQRVDVSLAPNPSGLIFVGNQLGIDGTAQASGNAALAGVSGIRATTLTAGSGLLGGGDLSANRRFDANIATQDVAQSGTDNSTLMTPLRVAQAIAVQGAVYTYTTTNINKTLSNRERCTTTSGFITLTLPAPPSQGNEISVVATSGSANVVISGAGYPIMGLQQNLTIDAVDKTVTLIYIDGTYGWRIF